MELCNTCTKVKCNKSIVITKDNGLTIIKCLDYEKDKNKIKKYRKPISITAEQSKALMDLNI